MSLIFRMIYVWLRSMRMERLPVGVVESRLTLRTLPNDLDLNMHMNNGRFLTICDLNRVDMFIRTGLVRLMFKNGWAPVVTEHAMQYRRPLKLWQRYETTMVLTHWDEKYFYMSHRFESDGKLVAEGTSKGVALGREGVVAPDVVFEALSALRGIPFENKTDAAA